jgi:phosphoglycerate kinase
MSAFRTLDDVELRDKRVLLRVDLNVPMENGRVTDATRIERVVPTITEIADKGAFRSAEKPRSEGIAQTGGG